MILGIGHPAYNMLDMDRALDYYCGILGLKKLFTLTDADGKPWIIYLKVADNQFIELFFKTSDEPAVNSSYNHLCLTVDDIYATAAYLKEHNVLTSDVRKGKSGNFQCWSADPEGNRIEFMQMCPDAMNFTCDK